MSYSISHHLCNCSLTSTIYWLPVGTHVSGTDPRFDPEEQLASAAADFGRALAKMKCPSNYLSGLTKYDLTSSILPIPLAMPMFCMVDVLSKFVPCLLKYYTLCDVQVLTVQFNFTNTSNKLCYHATLFNEDIPEMLPICYFWWMQNLLYLTCLSMYLHRVITGDVVVCH